MRTRAWAAAVAAFALLTGGGCGTAATKEGTPGAGTSNATVAASSGVATTKLRNSDGSTFTIAELEGKAKVVNFWATWCAPCIGEMPLLNEMAKKYETQGATFLAVSLDEEGPAKVDPVLKSGKIKIDFRKAFALEEEVKPLDVAFPIPDTLVFDGKNRLVKHFDKVVEREELEQAIQQALAAS